MAKIKKWQMGLIITLVIIVVLGIIGVTIWAVVFRDNVKEKFDYDSIKGFTRYEWYIGNQSIDENNLALDGVDINMLFGGSDKVASIQIASNDGGNTKLEDNRLVDISGTKLVVKVTDTEGIVVENTLTVVVGINVFNSREFNVAIGLKVATALQSDILLDGSRGGESYSLCANLYGNGHTIDPTEHKNAITGKNDKEIKINKIWNNLFVVEATDVIIRDIYIFGIKQEEGAVFTLSDFAIGGMLIVIPSGKSAIMENCMLENANRQILVTGGKVTIKGCFIRNSADACISVETTPDGQSNLTLENNLIANATVACVLVWGVSAINDAKSYPRIEIKGFLDMYNWKNRASAQIMPDHDPLSGAVNPLIKANINNKDFDSFFYKADGVDYAHLGILVIATGDLKGNNPDIIGFKDSGYNKRKFPLPGFASAFINTCDVIGFVQDAYIKPNSKIGSDIFAELKFGRRPA